jgi:hypothetical protein
MVGMEMIIPGSVTPRSTPQGRWGACASLTTTRAAKSRMSVWTARVILRLISFLPKKLERELAGAIFGNAFPLASRDVRARREHPCFQAQQPPSSVVKQVGRRIDGCVEIAVSRRELTQLTG